MTTQSRRIYNRTASAHINVSTPIPSSSLPSSSTSTSTPVAAATSKPSPSPPPPPTLSTPAGPVGAKKKKKKRTKGKSAVSGAVNDAPLDDEDLDYSRPGIYVDERDLTDDDIPELVDIDKPSPNQLLSVLMTATSSDSSKAPTASIATTATTATAATSGVKSKKKKKKNKAIINNDTSSGVEVPSVKTEEEDVDKGQKSKKIWNTNSVDEQERIKEFWAALSEQERRSLVSIDRDVVTKRIKEAKAANCCCHVCGRKQ